MPPLSWNNIKDGALAFSAAAPGAAFPSAWLLLSGAITALTYDDAAAPATSFYLIRAASDCDGLSSD